MIHINDIHLIYAMIYTWFTSDLIDDLKRASCCDLLCHLESAVWLLFQCSHTRLSRRIRNRGKMIERLESQKTAKFEKQVGSLFMEEHCFHFTDVSLRNSDHFLTLSRHRFKKRSHSVSWGSDFGLIWLACSKAPTHQFLYYYPQSLSIGGSWLAMSE